MTGNIQVGGGSVKSKRPKWQFFALLIVVALIAGGAGAGLRWWQNRDAPKPKSLPAPIQQSQDLAVKGDFEGAHREINKALSANNLSSQQKYELYLQQGTTYYNQSKYKEAVESYKKAVAFQETQNAYYLLAESSEFLEDSAAAIGYYKKAIELIPDDNPVGGVDKETYEERIRALGGQP